MSCQRPAVVFPATLQLHQDAPRQVFLPWCVKQVFSSLTCSAVHLVDLHKLCKSPLFHSDTYFLSQRRHSLGIHRGLYPKRDNYPMENACFSHQLSSRVRALSLWIELVGKIFPYCCLAVTQEFHHLL